MLHLPQSHNVSPFRAQAGVRMELSPVPIEDDELLRAIDESHGELWTLDSMPDTNALGEFWAGVQDDLHSDPTWAMFTDEGA